MKLSYGLLLWIALLLPTTAIAFQNTPSPQMNPANELLKNQNGAMRYEGEAQAAAGKVRTRLTFFNLDPNTVRQLAEQSADDGKTWTTTYDFKYVRKKSALSRRSTIVDSGI